MRYFELLNLRREPFSNSPDPDLFYRTKQHRECLQALEIAIRLKRGLSVVTGHVGTGKTTLCRQLLRVLGERQGVVTHLILDPSFSDAREFLIHLNGFFGVDGQSAREASDWQLRENIKNALLRQAVEEDHLVVLIVDEGQKMSLECLEILRELLNFETNEHKLLQMVIFGQLEFEPILEAKANLADRVNLRFRIGPLDFQDTRELILARLAMCSKDITPEGLFSFWAFLGVYLATDGFPRQIVQLCHQALLAVIIKEKPRVTWGVVRSCMRWRTLGLPRRRRWPFVLAAGLALVLGLIGAGAYLGYAPAQTARLKAFVQGIEMPDVASWFSPAKGAGEGAKLSNPSEVRLEGGPGSGGNVSGQVTGVAGAPATGAGSDSGPNFASNQATRDAAGSSGAGAQESPGGSGQVSGLASQMEKQPGEQSQTMENQNPEQPQAARESRELREPGPPRLTGVRSSSLEEGESLDILTDKPVDRFDVGFKSNPARVVVDLLGNWTRKGDKEFSVGSARVDKVRTAVQLDKLRVAIYLKDAPAGPFQPVVERTPTGLRLTLK